MQLFNPQPQVTYTGKMASKIRIIFVDNCFIDFQPQEEVNLPALIAKCRSDGYFLSDQCYVRFDMVRCLLKWVDDQPPTLTSVVQNAPTTETKQ